MLCGASGFQAFCSPFPPYQRRCKRSDRSHPHPGRTRILQGILARPEGLEPPTLCLEGRMLYPTELPAHIR